MELPEITEAKRLTLRPGDSLAVRLDREPSQCEAHEIATQLQAITGVPVVVLGPSMDVEIIGPEAGGAPKLTVRVDGDAPGEEFYRWLREYVQRRGGGSAVFA